MDGYVQQRMSYEVNESRPVGPFWVSPTWPTGRVTFHFSRDFSLPRRFSTFLQSIKSLAREILQYQRGLNFLALLSYHWRII